MPGYDTHTSQFGLVSGIRQSISDLINVTEPATPFAPEVRKGRLYIATEAEQDRTEAREACQLVARVIHTTFYNDSSFSVTSGLRAAIRAANKALYQENVNVPPRQRACVGLTCAVIKGKDLFVAQVAPAQAYVLNEKTLRAFPTHPSWNPAHLSATPFLIPNAVGASLFIEPELYRCTLQPGDALAICSSNVSALLKRTEIEAILHQGSAMASESLHTLYRQHGLANGFALVVELLPTFTTAHTAPLSPVGLRAHGQRAVQMIGDWLAMLNPRRQARQPESAARNGTPAQADPLKTMPEQPDYPANPLPQPEPIDVGASLHQRYAQAQEEQQRQRHIPPSALLGEAFADHAITTQERIDQGDGVALSARARPYRPRHEFRPVVDMTWHERLVLPLQKMGIALSDTFATLRRRRVPRPSMRVKRQHSLSYRRQKPASFPVITMLILSLLTALLVVYGLNLSHRSSLQRTQEELDQASQNMAAVYAAADDATALERLEQARQEINQIRASPLITETNISLWSHFQELQREFERAQAELQRLSFFDEPVILAEHPIPTGHFDSVIVPASTTTLTDTHALNALRYMYALDSDNRVARLYRIPRDGGAPEPFLTSGEAVQDTQVGPIYAQSWRVDNIVAVDQGPNGFGYYFRKNGSWNYTRLGGSEIWAMRDRLDMETYRGHLYVWGAETGEILKYESGRYGDPPILWIDPATLGGHDLTTAIDMAVDGNIYLLQPDGRILELNGGRIEREIVPEPLMPELTLVTRFFVTGSPGEGWFFILDTLNERIIQIEKSSGALIQQVRMRPDSPIQLDHLIDLYVDDTGVREVLYMVNGGQLIRTELPTRPQPFRQPTATPDGAG